MSGDKLTLEEMKAFVKHHDEAVINRNDLSVLETDISPDHVDHSALPGFSPGSAGAKAIYL